MKPSRYEEVRVQMEPLVYETVYAKNLTDPSIAFTHTRNKTLCGTIYRIYVNNSDEELADFLFLHECGHIIFAHARDLDIRMNRYLLSKIQAAFSRVAGLFQNYTEDLSMFRHALLNIAMDFEVNSRLFTYEEFLFMNERVSALVSSSGTRGMWPEDYGFPKGLTWNAYLTLMLEDPSRFITLLRNLALGTGKGRGSASSDAFDGHMTQKEYEEFRDNAQKALSKEELKDMRSLASEHNNATFDVPNGRMDGKSRISHTPTQIDFETYTDQSSLLKKMLRALRLKAERPVRRDLLYNTNRRKFRTTVIIPKTTRAVKEERRTLHLLIDVSGSVDAALVNDFLKTFENLYYAFSKVDIVTWNTGLVAQWTEKDRSVNRYGGGTNIAAGIRYLAACPGRLRSQDVLFVISDFEDELEMWNIALKKVRCRKFAVNWRTGTSKINPGFERVFMHEKSASGA